MVGGLVFFLVAREVLFFFFAGDDVFVNALHEGFLSLGSLSRLCFFIIVQVLCELFFGKLVAFLISCIVSRLLLALLVIRGFLLFIGV